MSWDPIFALFPIVLAIAVTWNCAAIVTSASAWDEGSEDESPD